MRADLGGYYNGGRNITRIIGVKPANTVLAGWRLITGCTASLKRLSFSVYRVHCGVCYAPCDSVATGCFSVCHGTYSTDTTCKSMQLKL